MEKSLRRIQKNIVESEKAPYHNHKKLFSFTKFTIILKSNDLDISPFDEDVFWFEALDLLQKADFNGKWKIINQKLKK